MCTRWYTRYCFISTIFRVLVKKDMTWYHESQITNRHFPKQKPGVRQSTTLACILSPRHASIWYLYASLWRTIPVTQSFLSLCITYKSLIRASIIDVDGAFNCRLHIRAIWSVELSPDYDDKCCTYLGSAARSDRSERCSQSLRHSKNIIEKMYAFRTRIDWPTPNNFFTRYLHETLGLPITFWW